MIFYVIEAFKKSKSVDDLIVVLDKEEFERGRIQTDYNVKTILGGATRNKSLKNAINYVILFEFLFYFLDYAIYSISL